jgi:DNA-binding CsgD family transcriptional regulator
MVMLSALYASAHRVRLPDLASVAQAEGLEPPPDEPARLARAIPASQALAARALLNHVPYGVIATDHAGRLLFGSDSALRVLAAETVLTVNDGVVRAVRLEDDEQLRALLVRVCIVPRPPTSPAELLTVGSGPQAVTLLATPMRNTRDRRLAAVLMPDSHRAAATCRLLAHLFGLTRSESELLKLTLTGRTVGEAAAELKLRARTAYERWRDVCLKLRARDESECLRLLHLALLLPVDDLVQQVRTVQRVPEVQEVQEVQEAPVVPAVPMVQEGL